MATCGHDHADPPRHGQFPAPDQIALVVLAAGQSLRMGTVKAGLPLRAPWGEPEGEPAVRRILRLACQHGIVRRLVVVGHHRDIVEGLVGSSASIAVNPRPERGMFSSVLAGLTVAMTVPEDVRPAATLVWPVDVPLVHSETLGQLLGSGHSTVGADERWLRQPALHHAPEQSGHPILLSRGLTQAVLEGGGQRLDHVLVGLEPMRQRVLVRDRFIVIDLDTRLDAEPYTTGSLLSAP